MKDRTKLLLSCLPFLLMLIGVAVVPIYQNYRQSRVLEGIRTRPTSRVINVAGNLEVTTDQRIYWDHGHLIYEIALIRIMVEPPHESGRNRGETTSGGQVIATPSTERRSTTRSSSSSRNISQSARAIPHGTRFSCYGSGYRLSFDAIQGCVCLGPQRINALEKPLLVRVDRVGAVQSIEPLPPQPLSIAGNLEAIEKVKEMARKYASGDDAGAGIQKAAPPLD